MKKLYISSIIALLVMLFVHSEAYGLEKPYLAPIPDQIASLGEMFTLDVNAQFADPPETYQLTVARPGMTINPTTGMITWVPASPGDGGVVTVRAYNTQGEAVRTFLIYITDALVCADALTSYWKMDDASGTSFEDFKGGYTMTSLTSLANVPTAKVGGGKTFAPQGQLDQFAYVPDQGQYDFSAAGGFSISMWIKYDGQFLAYDENQVLMARGTFESDGDNMFMMFQIKMMSGLPKLSFSLKPNNQEPLHEVITTSTLVVGQWTHVVAVYQGAPLGQNAYLRAYVNNVKTEKPYTWAAANEFNGNGLWQLEIGSWSKYDGVITYPYNGSMDEILIYDKALTPTEISAIYSDGLAGDPHCRPGDYFPLISSTPITSVVQDESYTYTFSAQDYEGDPLTLSAPTIPSFLTFSPGTGLLAGTPDNEDVGDHTVILKVTDGVTEVTQQFTLTVVNVNDPPVFTSTPILTASEGAAYTLLVEASDPDGDVLTYSAETLPSWLSFNPANRILVGIPARANAGDNPVSIKVTDGEAEVYQSFVIHVTSNNNAPMITSNPLTIVDNYTNYSYTITAYDADVADVLTYSAKVLPVWASFDPDTRTLSGTPQKIHVGDHPVILAVTDGYEEVLDEFTVTVRDVNTAPEIISVPDDTARVNQLYTYLMEAIDHDGDALTFNGILIPGWMTFSAGTKVLSGTPTESNLGVNNVIITVSDGSFTINHQFTISVVQGGVGIGLTDALVSRVYPNPANGLITFEFASEVSSVEISDLTGKVVIRKSVKDGDMSVQLDVSGLSNGLYMFRAIDGDQQQVGKIIIN